MNLFKRDSKSKDPRAAKPATPTKDFGAPVAQIAEGITEVVDLIAPSSVEVDFDDVRIGNAYFRTLFVSGYPRFVGANWLSPLINFDHSLDIAMYYYPVSSHGVLDNLRRKIAEMEATLNADRDAGKVTDAIVKAALEDALSLQEQLVKGVERFFQFSFYVTIPAGSLEELNNVTKRVEAILGSLLLVSKHATLQMEQAFQTTIPLCLDKLYVIRNMDTTSLATTFPFTSSELTANEGILYGINEHNGSLIIFDRFSLENANMVVFAKSGAGKSYLVKLEALRSLMFGTEVIVIDPEAEYRKLAQTIGGEYISFSQNEPAKINPFDLSGVYEEGENELGLKILSLHTLFKIIFKSLTPSQEALLDRALVATYKLKGITSDPGSQKNEPPIMEDLYKVLLGTEDDDARVLADQIERYIKGSLAGIFDQKSTVDIRNTFTVFSIRDLQDALRPIAMYIILDYVWTKIRKETKRRVLVVDEAWYLMQYPESATFIYSIAKRARKYYLGLTTLTQDVEDFLSSDYGKAIVTNSSLQVLFKQSPAAIDKLAEVFYLSQGEKKLLLSCNIGEGLFFAGINHVALQVVASPQEHKIITTSPKEILAMQTDEGRVRPPVAPVSKSWTKPPTPGLAPPPSTPTMNPSFVPTPFDPSSGRPDKPLGQSQDQPLIPSTPASSPPPTATPSPPPFPVVNEDDLQ